MIIHIHASYCTFNSCLKSSLPLVPLAWGVGRIPQNIPHVSFVSILPILLMISSLKCCFQDSLPIFFGKGTVQITCSVWFALLMMWSRFCLISSSFMGFSIINQPFWGIPYLWKPSYPGIQAPPQISWKLYTMTQFDSHFEPLLKRASRREPGKISIGGRSPHGTKFVV